MSFLRHRETHQIFNQRGRDYFGHAPTHPSDESPVGYSWRVALQQSPLPLHQPNPILRQLPANFNQRFARVKERNLTCGFTLMDALQTPPAARCFDIISAARRDSLTAVGRRL
jgi:hypothetical protein